ncbi:MAG: hypothetical protein JST16_14110 [Bdellovibrionales bacterium]|nr:hypothetical protein [Bdellovibrionales bacterium]
MKSLFFVTLALSLPALAQIGKGKEAFPSSGVDIQGVKVTETPSKELIQRPLGRFDVKKDDVIKAIDGQAVSPIEGASRLHAHETEIKEVTVMRQGKEVKLAPRLLKKAK